MSASGEQEDISQRVLVKQTAPETAGVGSGSGGQSPVEVGGRRNPAGRGRARIPKDGPQPLRMVKPGSCSRAGVTTTGESDNNISITQNKSTIISGQFDDAAPVGSQLMNEFSSLSTEDKSDNVQQWVNETISMTNPTVTVPSANVDVSYMSGVDNTATGSSSIISNNLLITTTNQEVWGTVPPDTNTWAPESVWEPESAWGPHHGNPFSLSVNANEFSPGKPYHVLRQQDIGDSEPPNNDLAIMLAQEAVNKLCYSPGSFESVSIILVDDINCCEPTDASSKELVNIIMKQAINFTNFTYNGARLCYFLHMKLEPEWEFRSTLMNSLAEEDRFLSEHFDVPECLFRIHGYTLFMAELFMVFMITGEDGKLWRLKPILRFLKTQLNKLLLNPTESNVKLCNTILRLVGLTIDECECDSTEQEKAQTSGIYETISEILAGGQLSVTTQQQLNILLQRRTHSWHTSPKPPVGESSTQPHPLSKDEQMAWPMYCLPDGTPIGPDEYDEPEVDMIRDDMSGLLEGIDVYELNEEEDIDFQKFIDGDI